MIGPYPEEQTGEQTKGGWDINCEIQNSVQVHVWCTSISLWHGIILFDQVSCHTLGNTVEELGMLCHEKRNSSKCPKVMISQYTQK